MSARSRRVSKPLRTSTRCSTPCAAKKIQSLFVEGGSTTLQSFIERDLWDEVWEERSPVVLESGIPAPTMPREFEARVEHHFGRTYRHWESPVLQKHYVDF